MTELARATAMAGALRAGSYWALDGVRPSASVTGEAYGDAADLIEELVRELTDARVVVGLYSGRFSSVGLTDVQKVSVAAALNDAKVTT